MLFLALSMSITHIIFDFDGVLIDTEGIYTEANSRCLKAYNKIFTNEMKSAQMGRKKEEGNFILEKEFYCL